MVNDKNSKETRSEVIRIIHDYLPLANRRSCTYIEENSDQELLKFFEASLDNCHRLIEELEFVFSISPPPQVPIDQIETLSDFWQSKLSRFWPFRRKAQKHLYYLEVPPDVTVDQLCEIAASGFWPMEFYKQT